jgi:putative oxidoreductase
MTRSLWRTDDSIAALILRLTVAVVILPHGLDKLGLFGGGGVGATLAAFHDQMGFPAWVGGLAIAVEVIAPVLLVLGAVTRLAALAIGVEMAIAALTVHLPNGFFMNWFGQKAGEGFEYHIMMVGATLALVVLGGGLWSVDGAASKDEVEVVVTREARSREPAGRP